MPERQAIDPVFLWGAHAPPRAPFRALAEGSARIRAQAVLVIRRKILTSSLSDLETSLPE